MSKQNKLWITRALLAYTVKQMHKMKQGMAEVGRKSFQSTEGSVTSKLSKVYENATQVPEPNLNGYLKDLKSITG